jgi:hypothetical protein
MRGTSISPGVDDHSEGQVGTLQAESRSNYTEVAKGYIAHTGIATRSCCMAGLTHTISEAKCGWVSFGDLYAPEYRGLTSARGPAQVRMNTSTTAAEASRHAVYSLLYIKETYMAVAWGPQAAAAHTQTLN